MSEFESYETVEVSIDAKIYRLKHAKTAAQRREGLAGRIDLDADGMLFSYETPVFRPFWMRRTFLPLVIAFFDENWDLVCSREMKPMQMDPILSTAPFKYAIEFVKGREPASITPLTVSEKMAKAYG